MASMTRRPTPRAVPTIPDRRGGGGRAARAPPPGRGGGRPGRASAAGPIRPSCSALATRTPATPNADNRCTASKSAIPPPTNSSAGAMRAAISLANASSTPAPLPTRARSNSSTLAAPARTPAHASSTGDDRRSTSSRVSGLPFRRSTLNTTRPGSTARTMSASAPMPDIVSSPTITRSTPRMPNHRCAASGVEIPASIHTRVAAPTAAQHAQTSDSCGSRPSIASRSAT